MTIFGESAGGAAAHYLILSPLAKGLFSKAISQSGSALNPWAYQTHPEKVAHQLAKDMNLTFTDNADLIRQLRQVSPVDMIRATPTVVDYVCLKRNDIIERLLIFSYKIVANTPWPIINSIRTVSRSTKHRSRECVPSR